MLPRREKVGIGVCDRDQGVSYSLRDDSGWEPEVDEKRHVAVAKVVHAEPGKVSLLRCCLHLLSHLVMREGKYPLMRLDALEVHHRAQFLFEEWWHLDDAPGRARLGRTRLVTIPDL